MKKSLTLVLAFVLGTFATDSYAQYLDDTPDSHKEKAPAEEGVEPVIPLDKTDPTYNLWKKMRDDLGKGREPGPIDIQRYYGGTGWNGIPTFFRLPVALTTEDLKAGDVDVAFL